MGLWPPVCPCFRPSAVGTQRCPQFVFSQRLLRPEHDFLIFSSYFSQPQCSSPAKVQPLKLETTIDTYDCTHIHAQYRN